MLLILEPVVSINSSKLTRSSGDTPASTDTPLLHPDPPGSGYGSPTSPVRTGAGSSSCSHESSAAVCLHCGYAVCCCVWRYCYSIPELELDLLLAHMNRQRRYVSTAGML